MFRFINTLNCLLTLADERSLSIERILINYRPIWNLVHSPLTRCRLETFGQIYHCFHLKLPDWFRYILTYRHIDRQVNKYCKKKKKRKKKEEDMQTSSTALLFQSISELNWFQTRAIPLISSDSKVSSTYQYGRPIFITVQWSRIIELKARLVTGFDF